MSLLDFTILMTRAVYILLTVTTIVNFIKEYSRTRLLIMLLFLSFSIAIVIDLTNEALGETLPLSELIRSLALIATPYLFLLLLKQSARVPVFVELFAAGMFIISGLFIIYFGVANLPVWATLLIVGYLVIVYLYSASQFLRNAIKKRGVTRWRKGMAATGMILLALFFWLVGLNAVIGSGHDYFLVMSQAASIGSAISLYLAFATPRWLRRVWQQGEMFNFLQLHYQNLENRQSLETLHLLKHYAQQAVGAEEVYLFDYNSHRGQFNLRQTQELPAAIFPDSDSDIFSEAMQRAITASQPYAVRYLGAYKGMDARLAEHLSARDAYFVPIRTADHLWGVLLLFLSNIPVFELDDLKLLAVMAEQSAQILENIHLLEEQADLIDKLREDTSNLRRSYADERRRFFRLSNDLLVIVGFDGAPILLNPAWEKVTGYTRDELMAMTFRDWVHPDDLASVEAVFGNLSQDTENITSQNRIVCKDGSVRWFQWNSATLIGRKAIYAAGHDVTETKRAHETMARLNAQLSHERARLENIMQSIPGLVWESWKEPDPEQDRIDFVSDHVEDMLGYTKEEWLSTPNFWIQIIHPEDRARVERVAAQQYQGEDIATTEFRWITKNGEELWCLSQTTVITDEEGKNVALRGVTLDITKRHEAERKLEELYDKLEDERERLENIIRSVPGIVWESYGDPSSQEKQRFRYVSDYAETMLGYPVEEWINTPGFWQKILHPNDKAKAISVAAQRYQNGMNTVNEYRWIAADGKPVWCMSQATPIRDRKGRTVGMRGVTMDISERKEAERSLAQIYLDLKRERERLANVVATVPGMVWEASGPLGQMKYVYVSGYAEQMFGYTPEELINDPELSIQTIHPEDRERALAFPEKRAQTDRTLSNEFRMITKNGELKWVMVQAVMVYDDQGNVTGMRGVTIDITEKKVSEEVRSRLAAIVSSSKDAIIGMDLNGNINSWNIGAGRIYQYEDHEVMGKPVIILVPPEHTDDLERLQAMEETLYNFETEHVTRHGRRIPVSVTSSPIKNDNGDYIGMSIITRDISEQKKTEAKLRMTLEKLSQSNKALQEFAYIASHDLQEPLRKVQAFGDRLKSKYYDALDERGRDYLDRMQSAADRMQRLIQDLLAYSRVTSKARPFEKVDLTGVVSQTIEMLDYQVSEARASVEVEELPTVEADALQMRQLFQNLISNSLKYSREDVKPEIRIFSRHLNNGMVEIHVKDNGIGFDQKYAERIFDFFQRLHGRMEYQGTGIGLTICRKIVERHNGSIRAEGVPDEGATFIITLPVIQIEDEDYAE